MRSIPYIQAATAPLSSLFPSVKKRESVVAKCGTLKMASTTYQKLLQVGTKIIAVGRNYAAHAKELGNAVPKEPVLFLKPTSSYLENGGTIEIPHPLESLDHEVELAVVIGQKARDIPESSAMDYVGGRFFIICLKIMIFFSSYFGILKILKCGFLLIFFWIVN